MTPDPDQIAKVIRKVTRDFGQTRSYRCYAKEDLPREINGGSCANFADRVKRRIPEANLWVIDDEGMTYHVFLEIGGRYYDAQSPHGVNTPEEIEYVKERERLFGPVENDPRVYLGPVEGANFGHVWGVTDDLNREG